MRFCWLFLIPLQLFAVEPYPAPPMQLTKQLPIEINTQNLELLQPDAKQNLAAKQQREIPWQKLLGVGLFFAVFAWARSQERRPKRRAKRIKEIQSEALSILSRIRVPSPEMIDSYYTQLTDVARGYLQSRFGVQAKTDTTQELVQELKRKPVIDSAQQHRLEHLLQLADRVKYAKHLPSEKESVEALKAVESIVNQNC